MIRSYLNIDNTTLGEQLFKNKQITKVSPSNSYEMLLTSNQIKEIVSNVIHLIESHYNQKIEIYIKNLWGYIQNNDELQNLTINPFIYNEGISIKPKWSFLYFVEKLQQSQLYLSVLFILFCVLICFFVSKCLSYLVL